MNIELIDKEIEDYISNPSNALIIPIIENINGEIPYGALPYFHDFNPFEAITQQYIDEGYKVVKSGNKLLRSIKHDIIYNPEFIDGRKSVLSIIDYTKVSMLISNTYFINDGIKNPKLMYLEVLNKIAYTIAQSKLILKDAEIELDCFSNNFGIYNTIKYKSETVLIFDKRRFSSPQKAYNIIIDCLEKELNFDIVEYLNGDNLYFYPHK